ncbi:HAMP domain-containing sensor histidine kinase [Sphingomonas sp. AOB5]|uniref:sensor histidine kinase n=1 Tax=Sphingomonas sp. AOB5 TaxID=3034017 RepID=UPI0023F843E4|nr:HAMP domain-containing sensor histidine kinase [Sphingomonas sp. AOB5]MDF7776310.1 HAMP domain-containing sensor histidine kinase [Sphingomonas sp. AOB5]
MTWSRPGRAWATGWGRVAAHRDRFAVITALKDRIKRHWPPLKLRTILFATLFFVAALPGIGAVFLRVYENTLVRQTESELIAQGSALAATARAMWPGATLADPDPNLFYPELPRIDLNSTPVLPERPAPSGPARPLDPAAAQAFAKLHPVMGVTRQTTLASILLLDRTGRITSDGMSYADLPEVRAALAGRPDTVLRRNGDYRPVYALEWLSRAAAIRVHHARPVIVDGKVVGVLLFSRSARTLFKGLYDDRGKIAFGILAIFAMLVLLSGLLSRGIARPIEALSAATRQMAAGRGSAPQVSPTAAIEIQGLYRDFGVMASAIDRRSRYLRDFAHAVSHEFKTPLAGIRGAIELLEDHDETMSEADRRRFLANAGADAARLSALVTRLLELARADMTPHDLDAVTLLAPVIARVADAMRGEDFGVELDLADTLPAVSVPEGTLETILTTMIGNSRQAGASLVRVSATGGDRVALTIGDDGAGISEADRIRIFEPFFTTRRAEGGTGLGLSIVASLLEAAGGAIRLEAADGPGTCFTLDLPIAEPERMIP